MVKRVLFVGNSHVFSVQAAIAQDECEYLSTFYLDREIKERVDGRNALQIARSLVIENYDVLCLMIRGNEYNILGLFNHIEPFHLAGSGTKGKLIPRDMMRGHFEEALDFSCRVTAAISTNFEMGLRFFLAAPPPIGDETFLRNNARTASTELHRGFSSAELRRELYEIQCEVQCDIAQKYDFEFLPPPTASMDSSGLLRKEYFNKDMVHANREYGRLVIEQIKQKVGA